MFGKQAVLQMNENTAADGRKQCLGFIDYEFNFFGCHVEPLNLIGLLGHFAA